MLHGSHICRDIQLQQKLERDQEIGLTELAEITTTDLEMFLDTQL
jgi:hypothetical protein